MDFSFFNSTGVSMTTVMYAGGILLLIGTVFFISVRRRRLSFGSFNPIEVIDRKSLGPGNEVVTLEAGNEVLVIAVSKRSIKILKSIPKQEYKRCAEENFFDDYELSGDFYSAPKSGRTVSRNPVFAPNSGYQVPDIANDLDEEWASQIIKVHQKRRDKGDLGQNLHN